MAARLNLMGDAEDWGPLLRDVLHELQRVNQRGDLSPELIARIEAVESTASTVLRRVQSLEQVIRGNGQPGLRSRLEGFDIELRAIRETRDAVEKLERRIAVLDKDLGETDKGLAVERAKQGGISAVVAAVVAALMALVL